MENTLVHSVALRREAVKAVKECREYWRRRNVPPFVAEELVTELESHLEGALSDGKTPGEAIGSPREWAKTQAGDCSKPRPLNDCLVDWASVVLCVGAVLCLLLHALQWDSAFHIGSRGVVLVGCIATATRLLSSASASFVVFNAFHRKGVIAYGDYWCFCAGLLLSRLIPLESVTEAQSMYIQWSWSYTLLLIAAALTIEVYRRSRRYSHWTAATPDLGKSPGLALVDEAYQRRKRELEHLALRWSVFSTCSTGLGWLINPGEEKWITLVYMVSLCLMLFLLYPEMKRQKANKNSSA